MKKRTILFRGISQERKAWVYGYYYRGKIDYILTPARCLYIQVIPNTVCQYTGFTDKAGNPIYEWDICDWVDKSGRKWRDTVNMVRGKWQLEDDLWEAIEYGEVLVIGNEFGLPNERDIL